MAPFADVMSHHRASEIRRCLDPAMRRAWRRDHLRNQNRSLGSANDRLVPQICVKGIRRHALSIHGGQRSLVKAISQ